MVLNHRGVVDSEDGLLIFGDAEILQQWCGTDNEQIHFDTIVASTAQGQPGLNIPIGNATAVVWDIEGPGTTDVYCTELSDTIVLIRYWLDDSESNVENDIVLDSTFID